MKHLFLATSGLPGTNNFNGLMFEVETKTDMTQSEVTDSLRKATRKYVMTDRGANYLQNTCGSFDWGDFVDSYDVPEFAKILAEAGLTVTFLGSVDNPFNLLDWEEQLIDDRYSEVSPDLETVEELMDAFFEGKESLADEIEDVKGTISNERLWEKGASTDEERLMHAMNIATQTEYLSRLKRIGGMA